MNPAINVGDLVITVETPSSQIHVGDVIEYSIPSLQAPIMHRVIQISGQGSGLAFTTKGDANNIADPTISPPLSIGKVAYIIPSIGWVTIYIDEAFGTAINFLAGNLYALIAFLGGVVSVSFAGLYLYNKRMWGR